MSKKSKSSTARPEGSGNSSSLKESKFPYSKEEALSDRLLPILTKTDIRDLKETTWEDETYELMAEQVLEPKKLAKGLKIVRVLNEFSFWYLRDSPQSDNICWRPTPPVPGVGEKWSHFQVRGRAASLNGPARYLAMAGEFFVKWPTMESIPIKLDKGTITDIAMVKDPLFRDSTPALAIYTKRYIYFLLTPDYFFEESWKSVLSYWETYMEVDNLYIPDLDHTEPRSPWWHGKTSHRAFRRWKRQYLLEEGLPAGEEDHSRDGPQPGDKDDDKEDLADFLKLNLSEEYLFSEEEVTNKKKTKGARSESGASASQKGKLRQGLPAKGKSKGRSTAAAKQGGDNSSHDDEVVQTDDSHCKKKSKQPVTGRGPPKRPAMVDNPVYRSVKRKTTKDATTSRIVCPRSKSPSTTSVASENPNASSERAENEEPSMPKEGPSLQATHAPGSTSSIPTTHSFSTHLPNQLSHQPTPFVPVVNEPEAAASFPSLSTPHMDSVRRGMGGLHLGAPGNVQTYFPSDGWRLGGDGMDRTQYHFSGSDSDYQPADNHHSQPNHSFVGPFSPLQPLSHSYVSPDNSMQFQFLQMIQSALHGSDGDAAHPYDEAAPGDMHFPAS
ncbi:unnamed protein product [Rhizoctonia solani]|uniref:Uncharacterized protein n=1 Tax=Rhizoctonia solani TaxID=456999 RepID=A0A8H2WC79_9AGAM|nr:unnamed protein product [Rhizoctonia solani]